MNSRVVNIVKILSKLKDVLPKEHHADINQLIDSSSMLEFDRLVLSKQLEQLDEKLEKQKKAIEILLRQSDEWAKSYDRLLKDFIHYRETN